MAALLASAGAGKVNSVPCCSCNKACSPVRPRDVLISWASPLPSWNTSSFALHREIQVAEFQQDLAMHSQMSQVKRLCDLQCLHLSNETSCLDSLHMSELLTRLQTAQAHFICCFFCHEILLCNFAQGPENSGYSSISRHHSPAYGLI